MADMKLNAEVFLRIDGHEEMYNMGTIDVPINVTFGDKPTLGHKPRYRGGGGVTVQLDEAGLGQGIEAAVARTAIRT